MGARKLLVALATVAGVILGACASAGPPSLTLNDTRWLLATLNSQSVVSGTLVTLSFENDKLTGTDGCNRYIASYTLNGARITVNRDIATTKMACSEPIMKQADSYLAALPQAASYESDGQRLTLMDASGKVLATFAAQSRDLAGTSWTVTGVNNGQQSVVSVVGGTNLTADFSADGKLSGLAGCNNYTTTYEAFGKSIKTGPTAATTKFCAGPPGIMEQEKQFLEALETAMTYRIDGNQLELRTADGALAITLQKVR